MKSKVELPPEVEGEPERLSQNSMKYVILMTVIFG
jgi:hypothetical protein